jgi:hypothetical protein
MDEFMLSNLTFCRPGMVGEMVFGGGGGSKHNGKARPKSKCDNARRTYAYPTKLGGLGQVCNGYS